MLLNAVNFLSVT